jgi:hypothetical protein
MRAGIVRWAWLVRGSLAAVAVGALLASCTADTTPPPQGETARGGPDSGAAPAKPQGLVESAEAASRLRGLRSRFQLERRAPIDVPIKTPDDVDPLQPMRVERVPVLQAGGVERFEPEADRVLAVTAEPPRMSTARHARVRLPVRAQDPLRVEDVKSGVAIELVLGGVRQAKLATADGLAVWAGAAPDGGDVVARVHPEGVEDYVAFERAPAVPSVTYQVDVRAVAGVRLVDNVLEFLDAKSAPRLRMVPPHLVDAAGDRHEATVSVGGCAYDTDQRVPWDRPVTPPGSSSCMVTVRWDGASVAYPALLDPAWVTTGSMTYQHSNHTAVKLQNGRVLVAGGYYASYSTDKAEVYDPVSGSFSGGGTMVYARGYHGASLLASGKVLVTGGLRQLGSSSVVRVLSFCELYNPGTNTWGLTAQMTVGGVVAGRVYHSQTADSSGNALVAGGQTCTSCYPPTLTYSASAAIYVSSSEAWQSSPAVASMNTARALHAAVYAGSFVNVFGGTNTSFAALNTAEYYSFGTNTWTAFGNTMSVPRTRTAAGLGRAQSNCVGNCDRVVVAGGAIDDSGGSTSAVDIAQPYSHTFSASTALGQARQSLAATTVVVGVGSIPYRVVFTGGRTGTSGYPPPTTWDKVDSYVSTTSGISRNVTSPMVANRAFHTGTRLDDERILVAGGANANGASNTAELFTVQANGLDCNYEGDCQSRYCVDDRCCSTSCAGNCKACSSALTGGPEDGVCRNVKADTDPDGDCPEQAASTCGYTGVCSSGACATWPVGTECVTSTCVANTRVWTECAGFNSCTQGRSQDCTPGVCQSGSCVNNCANDSQCPVGHYCNASFKCEAKHANGWGACTRGEPVHLGLLRGRLLLQLALLGALPVVLGRGQAPGVERRLRVRSNRLRRPERVWTGRAVDLPEGRLVQRCGLVPSVGRRHRLRHVGLPGKLQQSEDLQRHGALPGRVRRHRLQPVRLQGRPTLPLHLVCHRCGLHDRELLRRREDVRAQARAGGDVLGRKPVRVGLLRGHRLLRPGLQRHLRGVSRGRQGEQDGLGSLWCGRQRPRPSQQLPRRRRELVRPRRLVQRRGGVPALLLEHGLRGHAV